MELNRSSFELFKCLAYRATVHSAINAYFALIVVGFVVFVSGIARSAFFASSYSYSCCIDGGGYNNHKENDHREGD